MENIKLLATKENTNKVIEFIDSKLESVMCPIKVQSQIDIAVDEIFGNIVNYAYNPEIGEAEITISFNTEKSVIEITFMDCGVEYNPLAKKDPDVTLSVEDRQIGGLGIFMMKNLMDDISYKYEDGKNILTLRKNLDNA